MTDDYFERFNTPDPAEQDNTASTPSDNGYNAYMQADTSDRLPVSEPVFPSQPAQPDTWHSTYHDPYSAPRANTYGDNYVSRPAQSTPSINSAYATRVTPQQQATTSPNTYIDSDGYYHRSFTEHRPAAHTAPQREAKPQREEKAKEKKSGSSKGVIAALMVGCILLSGIAGFGGSMLANNMNNTGSTAATDASAYESVSDQLVVHKVNVVNSSETTGELVDKSTDEITRLVADSVVEITTEVVQTNGYYGQYIAQGAGSGVIISTDGYIVTNNHVIEDTSNITVTLRSGESYDAELIGTDSDEDIALLKIDATDLTTAIFGDSADLEVGDKSIIIGNPLGTLGGSVTEGIVSALDRSIVIDGKTMHLMQTDAAINPGNSGGGMFNGQGELVGIVVAKSGGTTSSGSTIDNIGFVIPINNVLNILGDLKQYGYVRGKADTGMSFVDITNQMYAWYYYGSSSTGVYISSVDRGSNAAEAGFKSGDRVISVDGKSVSSASDVTSIISEHSAGDTITFEIERSGRTGTIDLTLEEYTPQSNSSSSSDNDDFDGYDGYNFY